MYQVSIRALPVSLAVIQRIRTLPGSSTVSILMPAMASRPSIRVRVRAETAAQTMFWPGSVPSGLGAWPSTVML